MSPSVDRSGSSRYSASPECGADAYDVVCLSHLRWDFVWQRPQHLLSRFARERRVFFVEEARWGPEPARAEVVESDGVHVVRMHMQDGTAWDDVEPTQRALLDAALAVHDVDRFVLWCYTPMALGYARHLSPVATVYDCMDELSLFRGAHPALLQREDELLGRADLVFTGGASLYGAKAPRHPSVHLFPSSVDVAHFARARTMETEPADQAALPRPRLGYFGVIDERIDLALVDGIAAARPGWQVVMVGPTAKIDEADLPRRANLHYVGMKSYAELPGYLAGWDVAMLPFALNDSTRFISPTKTPEYLAAGRPAISTPVRDVVGTYGRTGLVAIASTVDEWVAAAEEAMARTAEERAAWQARVDDLLATTSWESVWEGMKREVERVVRQGAGDGGVETGAAMAAGVEG